jgi:hypothetical protein
MVLRHTPGKVNRETEDTADSAKDEEFDPYSFAERWYEEHPEALKGFDMVEKMKGGGS